MHIFQFLFKWIALLFVVTGTQVTQPPVIVATRHGEATLICDYSVFGKMEEIRFSLLKKTNNRVSEICVLSFNTKYETASVGNNITCLGTPSPHNVIFNISGLQAEDTGLYTCKMEVMYPPPYRAAEGNATLVYISGKCSSAFLTETLDSKMNIGLLTIISFMIDQMLFHISHWM